MKVAIESRRRAVAFLKSRTWMRKSASYTFIRLRRSQSPPSSSIAFPFSSVSFTSGRSSKKKPIRSFASTTSSFGPSATVFVSVSSYAASAISFSPIRMRKSAFARYASRISVSPSFSAASLIFSSSLASSAAFAASSSARKPSGAHPSFSHSAL